jgi:carboxyl-terminal processing protease
MRMGRRWVWIGLLALLPATLAMGIAVGIWVDREFLLTFVPPEGVPPDAVDDFELMAEAWNTIDEVYVDREALETPNRTYGAISGMVDGLGDTGHSRFLDPEMVKAQRLVTEGEFEGIGAYVEMREGLVVIVAPIDGSPAQAAGLKAGDVIIEVDGRSVAGLPLDQVVGWILGPAGTRVSLTILDPVTGLAREVEIERASVRIHDVTWERLPGSSVGLVRIARFSNGVTDDLLQALANMRQVDISGIVLDLRNNPGGLLGEAVGVTSQFVEEGNVLLERDASGTVTPVPVEPGGVALDIPVVVLINGGSASGSEIVAGALQDAERATLLGEGTFGTGTVLQEFPLSDGSALLLAIKEWLTPAGRVIWREGLEPDMVVDSPLNRPPVLPDVVREMTPDELRGSGDEQLLRALDLLE